MEELFKNYKGKIYVRKLTCNRNVDFYNKLEEAHSIVHNRTYDTNIIDWIKAAFDLNFGNTQRLNEFWCSAMVAFIYTKLGFLPEDTPWTLISPSDLSSHSNNLYFYNCELSNDIKLTTISYNVTVPHLDKHLQSG